MPHVPSSRSSNFCREILPLVSRTYSLSIPFLPTPLDSAVVVAYLLCRVADTLEDEVDGPARGELLKELARLTRLPERWQEESLCLSAEVQRVLRAEAPAAEVRLAEGLRRVLEVLAAHPEQVREHVARCVETMAWGMGKMGRLGRVSGDGLGLASLDEMMEYCYFAAGTAGEMLTRLFAWHSPRVEERLARLEPRAVAFGNALQLTNILRDVRSDMERGCCWLPRTVLTEYRLKPEEFLEPQNREAALEAHGKILAVAHGELRVALEYALALPQEERGIRLFCLWPIFLAALTLRKLYRNEAALSGGPVVKVSRHAVNVVKVLHLLAPHDSVLRRGFLLLTAPLPSAKAPMYALSSVRSRLD